MRRTWKCVLVSGAVAAVLALGPESASAVELKFGDEGALNIFGYLQPRFDANLDGAGAQKYDFSVKRIRLLFMGHLSKRFHFAVGTLTNNFGLGGNYDADIYLADVWIGYHFAKSFRIHAGLMKGGFGRASYLAGSKLDSIDWRTFYLKRGVGRAGTRPIPFRDMGIRFSGVVPLPKGSLDYRISIMDGMEPGGGADNPRFVGRIAYNLLDAEPEFHIANTYLGKRRIATFGVSTDIQSNVAVPDGAGIDSDALYDPKKDLYYAVALDLHLDLPFGHHGVIFDAAFHYWGGSLAVEKATAKSPHQLPQGKGLGLWAQLGYRYKKYEPLVGFDYYRPDADAAPDRKTLIGGFNWWFSGIRANLKAQFAITQIGDGDWLKTLTVQSQLLFR